MLSTHNLVHQNYESPWVAQSAPHVNAFGSFETKPHSFDVPAQFALRHSAQFSTPQPHYRAECHLTQSKMSEPRTDTDVNEAVNGKIERHKYSTEQIELLLEIFKEIKYPNVRQRKIIGRRMSIKPEQVKTWFQNRRRRTLVEQTNNMLQNGGKEKIEPQASNTGKKLISDDVVKSILRELNNLKDSEDEALKKKNKGFKRKLQSEDEPTQQTVDSQDITNPPKRVTVQSSVLEERSESRKGVSVNTSQPIVNLSQTNVLNFSNQNSRDNLPVSTTESLHLSMLTPQDRILMQNVTAAAICGSASGLPSKVRESDTLTGRDSAGFNLDIFPTIPSSHAPPSANVSGHQDVNLVNTRSLGMLNANYSNPSRDSRDEHLEIAINPNEDTTSVTSERLSSRRSSFDEMAVLWGGHGRKAVAGNPDLHDKLLGVSDDCPPPNRVAPSPLTAEYLAITNDINGYPYATPFGAFSSVLDIRSEAIKQPSNLSVKNGTSERSSTHAQGSRDAHFEHRNSSERYNLLGETGVIPPNRVAPPSGPIPFFPLHNAHATPLQVSIPPTFPNVRLPSGSYQGLLKPLTPESQVSSTVSYLPDDMIVRRLMNFAPKEVQSGSSRHSSRTSSLSDDIDVETIDDIIDDDKRILDEASHNKVIGLSENVSASSADVTHRPVRPTTESSDTQNLRHHDALHTSLPSTSLPGLHELMTYKIPPNVTVGQTGQPRPGSVHSFSFTSSGSNSSLPSLPYQGLEDLYLPSSVLLSNSPGTLSSLRNHVDPSRYPFPYGSSNPLNLREHHKPLSITSIPNPFY